MMRREMKIGIGIGVVVVAFGLWYLVSGDPAGTPQDGEESLVSLPTDGEAPAVEPEMSDHAEPAPEVAVTDATDEPAPGPSWLDGARGSDTLASPPVFNVDERSDRPEPASTMDTTSIPTLDEPSDRVGLGDVAGVESEPVRPEPSPTIAANPSNASDPAITLPSGRTGAAPGDRRAPTADATHSGDAAGMHPDRRAPQPGESAVRTHKIESGDTFSGLAARYLGHAKHANLIAKANPDTDPRRLRIGMEIKIPAAPEAVSTTSARGATPADSGRRSAASPAAATTGNPIPEGRSYTVQQGELWSHLASRFLKDANRWPELYELNRGRVPRNPDLLRAGTVIELPAEAAANNKP